MSRRRGRPQRKSARHRDPHVQRGARQSRASSWAKWSGPRPDRRYAREAFRTFMTSHRLRPTSWAKDAGVATRRDHGLSHRPLARLFARRRGKTGARRQGARRRYVQMIVRSSEADSQRIVAGIRAARSGDRVALERCRWAASWREDALRADATSRPRPSPPWMAMPCAAADQTVRARADRQRAGGPSVCRHGRRGRSGAHLHRRRGAGRRRRHRHSGRCRARRRQRHRSRKRRRPGRFIRARGPGFRSGRYAGERGPGLTARDLALLAAGDLAQLSVRRRPRHRLRRHRR